MSANAKQISIFKYPSLTKGYVRMVVLQPASNHYDALCCDLIEVPFTKNLVYEALSYTWGNPAPDALIHIEKDRTLGITQNLESALRHLRFRTEPRTLWIDAICIDQTSIPERNAEVRRMAQIYTNANNVVIWLGPEADNSDAAMAALLEIAAMGPESSLDSIYGSLEGPHDEAPWEAIALLMKRPWWKRMWIIQEATAPTAITVCCGTAMIPFLDFERALNGISIIQRAIKAHRNNMTTMMNHFGNYNNRVTGIDTNKPVLSISPWPIRFLQNFRLERQSEDLKTYMKQHYLSLHRLLEHFSSRDATDPRDKVYALTSLVESITSYDNLLDADYNLPVQAVYARTTQFIILSSVSLDILSHCCNPDKISGLPSWVPDWSTPPSRGTYLAFMRYCYDPTYSTPIHLLYGAAANVPLDVSFEADGFSLICKGIIFDSCSELLEQLEPQSFFPGTGFSPTLMEWRTRARRVKTPYIHTKEGTEEALRRTFAADVYPEGDEWRRGGLGTDKFNPSSDGPVVMEQDKPYAMNRRFGYTQGAYMGLFPPKANVGDVVCILYGSSVPFVLRKVDQHYEYIGECYVHGAMDGEVVWEFRQGKYEESTFEIR